MALVVIIIFVYDVDLVENAKFEIYPSRKLPHSIRDQVKMEIDSMIKNCVIKVQKEPTEAVSPMVVVKKKRKIEDLFRYYRFK